jgi:hypothetical protein
VGSKRRVRQRVLVAVLIAAGLFTLAWVGSVAASSGRFDDDDGNVHEPNIDAIAEAGITRGCNPPANTSFCPQEVVTRGQMAAFLVRALGYDDAGAGDLFDDDDGSIFERDIDILGTAGITKGCDPPDNTMFCPDDPVRRDQMASFLARALELIGPSGPGDTTTTTLTTTMPPPVPILVGAGDIASSDPADSDTAAIIVGLPEATVFTTGDNAYPDGTAEDFAAHYDPTWGVFKDRTYPSIGNHDDHTEGATAYFDYFGANAGTPGEGWYSYDLGNWHIVVLNSECGDAGFASCAAQEEWLTSDLQENAGACLLAYWHKPLFTSGHHEPGSSTMREAWAILDDAGAELVINGHDHNYQRYAPQDADGNLTADGIVEFVVGTGGKGLYEQVVSLPNLEQFYVGYGVLKLELGTDEYTWEFIPTTGESVDGGSGSCADAG